MPSSSSLAMASTTAAMNGSRFDDISYKEVISRGLKVMDTAAVALCMENNMPIFVFKMEKGNLTRAAVQGDLGTLVHC